LQDILNDSAPEFSAESDMYVFKTETNYKHKDLKYQKIKLAKKDLKPISVKIMDNDKNVLVDMNFTAMDFGYEFDDNAFDVRKNMAQSKMEVPAMAQKGKNASFNVYLPTNVPDD